MREIKFKVWNGLEMIYDVTVGKFGAFYVNPGDKKNGLDPRNSDSLTPLNTKYPDTIPVMQFTGVKDKNGKEIYEGDIVTFTVDSAFDESETFTEEVKFEDGTFCIDGYVPVGSFSDEMEIIGNIHQNPDLLETQNPSRSEQGLGNNKSVNEESKP